MPRRVRIQGGSSNPFQVSAADVDADDTFSLIFDGNQPPLRLHSEGVVAAVRSSGNIAPAVFTQSATGYTAPAGLFPLFALAEFKGRFGISGEPSSNLAQNPQIQAQSPPPPWQGFGGALANGFFYGMNFTNLSSGVDTKYINFIIFRNMG